MNLIKIIKSYDLNGNSKKKFSAAIAVLVLVTSPAFAADPVLNPIGPQSVDETTELTFTATATDADLDPLTFSLAGGAPAGAVIDSISGVFSWTPSEAEGPGTYFVTVQVSDGVPGNAVDDSETVTVTVNEVNVAPVLDPIGNKTIDEGSALTFTATATDVDVPPNVLTFSLAGIVPAGASITAGGAFSWTPSEAQGPGVYTFDVVVTDNGTPNLSDSETIAVTVNDVNSAPVLDPIGNKTVDELTELTFTATATDADVPPNVLTFSLAGSVPAGAGITAGGAFSWTPSETQGPGVYTFDVVVTDNGAPNLSDSETIAVTVNEVNANTPILDPIGNKTVDELTELTFTATATDDDLPDDTLTFSLDAGAPAGAGITAGGAFSWTPTEAQGPGSYPITVRVTDSASNEDFETISVTVNEVNANAPVLDPIGNKTVDELTELTFTATASDDDLPDDTLTFSLDAGAPAGAGITAGGAFSWTPTEAQGPGSYSITVRVTDSASNEDFETITVTVNEVNANTPILDPIGNKTVDELTELTFTATATDDDLPDDTLTFSLDAGAPAGAGITAGGAFSWTPTEAQGPGSYPITVRVTDAGSNEDFETISVTVDEVNANTPVLASIGNRTVNEGNTLTFTATATDGDLPDDTLTFSLDAGAPAGAAITAGGVFSWPTTEADGPGTYNITVRVTDAASNDDSETIVVTVDEVNANTPVLASIGNRTVNEGNTLTFTATATDGDLPDDTLTFSLDAGAPAGAAITAGGVFSWPTTEADGPGTYNITVRVTDAASNDDSETIVVTVDEVNANTPVLASIGNRTVNEGNTLTFTATATDGDLPDDTLTFSLDAGAPAGAGITAGGAFSWTPTEAQGPGSYSITVRVTDAASNDDFETITVTVDDVNVAPVLNPIGSKTVNEGSTLNFTASASDADVPANALTFSLAGTVPGGAGITTAGVFSWATGEADGPGTYTFDVVVTDNGTPNLSDRETITVTVNEVNQAPVLATIGNKTVDEGSALTFTATATDGDLPDDTLTFSLDAGAPAGAGITAGGAFSWTPTEAQGPDSYSITVRVTDDGTPTLSDFETITVTVNEVNEAPTANDDEFDVTEGESTVPGLNVLVNDTDPDSASPVLTAELITAPSLDPAFVLNSDGTFSYTHDGSETSSDSFTYRACDDGTPSLCSATATVTITVDNVNDAPVIESQQAVSTAEETALLITLADLVVTDVDSDPASFVLSVQDGTGYTRSDNTITPNLDFNGDLSVPVTVSDGEADSAVFNLVVTVTAVNDAPVIIGQASLVTAEDASLTVLITDITVVDPDNVFPDDFTLELFDGANYTRTGNTITPILNFNDPLNVPATVSDGELPSAQFILTIDVTAENDQPVLETPIEDQLAIEGTAFSLDISGNFTDADGDLLQFTASNLPASGNLVFDPVTGVISGTPQLEDARDTDPYIVTITATDGDPGTIPATDEFNLNISALDRANVSLDISVAPDPAMLNDELSWTFTASNISGPQSANNVEVTGSFVGPGLSITSASSCTIEAAVDQVTDFNCVIGSLAIGEAKSVALSTVTSSAGDVVVFATAANADPLPLDPNLADNSRQVAVGVAEQFSNGAVEVLGSASVLSMVAGDVNGDGAADLVIGTVAGQPVQIYLSDGFRAFVTPPISLPDNAANEGIALADFDNNGTLDLVVANGDGQPDGVYSNDGAGNFTLVAEPGSAPTSSHDVAAADFNRDGNMDIVFATIVGNPVYLGDGFGNFSLYATLGAADSHGIVVADFDGTSGPDIVFANVGSDSQVWLNNGVDGFDMGDSLSIGDAVSVTAGQFGGDAALDLAFGRVPMAIGDVPANPVLINDGLGSFGNPVALLGTSATNDIHAGDVNRDGLTDLVFINANGVHQIWTATGNGFELHGEQIVDGGAVVGVLAELGFADVGDPGGVDLALGGATMAGSSVYLNDGFGNLGRGDAVSPVLTLNGAASVSVPAGSNYVDSGAIAEDNIDGDISSAVVISGAVNTALVGSYTLTYNVSDSAGNDATPITRTVNVTPAAGSGGGGGGGGAVGPLLLLLLMFATCLSAWQAKRAIIRAGAQKQN